MGPATISDDSNLRMAAEHGVGPDHPALFLTHCIARNRSPDRAGTLDRHDPHGGLEPARPGHWTPSDFLYRSGIKQLDGCRSRDHVGEWPAHSLFGGGALL